MKKSKFSQEEKLQILREKELENRTVEEICVKYQISLPTYYNWKRKLKPNFKNMANDGNDPQIENQTLRRLYTDLSEHNYQLAKFLSK